MRLSILAFAAALALSSPAATAAPDGAAGSPDMGAFASCGNVTQTNAFPGGYKVKRLCGGYYISGMGTVLNDAVVNAGHFGAFSPAVRCYDTGVDQHPGGYVTRFSCSNKSIGGFGTTVTDAATIAKDMAALLAGSSGVSCGAESTSAVSGFPGGFQFNMSCRGTGTPLAVSISGVGTTASDAGDVALGFAQLVATTGNSCFVGRGDVRLSGMLYEILYSCDGGKIVRGYGSTATSAALDALANAQAL